MAATEQLAEAMSSAVQKHVAAKGDPKRIEMASILGGFKFLIERIEKLEASPIEYAGRHYADKSYRKNQLITHNGRLWICTAGATREQPGNSADWDMVANKGRDGKDAT